MLYWLIRVLQRFKTLVKIRQSIFVHISLSLANILPPSGCNFRALKQGSTVALQSLYSKRNWLGCSGETCVKDTCPGLYMEGIDWDNCPADVYQIYRRNGPGTVNVGDTIGLHHPSGGQWFSAFGGTGHRNPCPGTPTTGHGFKAADRWVRCFGEVFRIYARGKSSGDVINEHDAIFLFYEKDNEWVGFDGDTAEHRTCPGKVRPPISSKYDECWGEVFEVWKR